MPSTVQIFHAAPGLDVRSQGPSLTAAVLISDPLIVNPFAVRFTIESFDHGHTSPSGRRWSWFEASVVRKVDDAQESALKMPMEQLATPSDFDPLLRTQGWHIVPIEKAIDFEGFPVLTERPSTFLAHNPLKPVASTHVRTWNQSHPDRSIRNWNALLSVLQRGDRIAVWARAKVRSKSCRMPTKQLTAFESRDFVNHTISVQAELFSVVSSK